MDAFKHVFPLWKSLFKSILLAAARPEQMYSLRSQVQRFAMMPRTFPSFGFAQLQSQFNLHHSA